jgi:hypothetical protein
MLPPQPNFLTLACRDVERMADFLRALGWPETRLTAFAASASTTSRNIWDVVYKVGSAVAADGSLTFAS